MNNIIQLIAEKVKCEIENNLIKVFTSKANDGIMVLSNLIMDLI